MRPDQQLPWLLLLVVFSAEAEERQWLSQAQISQEVPAEVTATTSTTASPATLEATSATTSVPQVPNTSSSTKEYTGGTKNEPQTALPETEKLEEENTKSNEENVSLPDTIPVPAPDPEVSIGKKKKPRKWMSIPTEDEGSRQVDVEGNILNVTEDVSTQEVLDELEIDRSMKPSVRVVSEDLPRNTSDEANGVPVMTEMIMSKKTTIYVTFMENMPEAEPVYVNLTGIRDYTGTERRIFGGLLDLSDLLINGDEAKEVIHRMAKHKFHRLDLSNNAIRELPPSTFSPLAFTLRELRLDGNPLSSNPGGGAGPLQRGGLFHLTELRELNLSSCGLEDIDLFTPWNSNKLEVIDLSNNALKEVPTNLQFFHHVKKLYLDGNPIRNVSELPFALLWGMQTLSMNGCQLTAIASDPFRNMEKLKELSLAGNNLTRVGELRLPRGAGPKLWLSGNPWHCSCEMLSFVDGHQYAVRDLEDIRCSTPRWLEGLRAAYLTKEILSLDSTEGGCPSEESVGHVERSAIDPSFRPYAAVRADRLEVLSLVAFALAAVFMVVHVLWGKRKNGYSFPEDRDDIKYIKIEKKPNFK